MELLEHTTTWVKGEVLQGKIMVSIAILVLIGAIAIFKSDHELLRGALIPLGLVVLVLGGYGGFQTFGRPGHIQKVTEIYEKEPEKALDKELTKAKKDDRVFSTAKIVWSVLMVASIGLFFLVNSDYYKGLSIGLVALFFALLILDTLLHFRLKIYLEAMTKLISD